MPIPVSVKKQLESMREELTGSVDPIFILMEDYSDRKKKSVKGIKKFIDGKWRFLRFNTTTYRTFEEFLDSIPTICYGNGPDKNIYTLMLVRG